MAVSLCHSELLFYLFLRGWVEFFVLFFFGRYGRTTGGFPGRSWKRSAGRVLSTEDFTPLQSISVCRSRSTSSGFFFPFPVCGRGDGLEGFSRQSVRPAGSFCPSVPLHGFNWRSRPQLFHSLMAVESFLPSCLQPDRSHGEFSRPRISPVEHSIVSPLYLRAFSCESHLKSENLGFHLRRNEAFKSVIALFPFHLEP